MQIAHSDKRIAGKNEAVADLVGAQPERVPNDHDRAGRRARNLDRGSAVVAAILTAPPGGIFTFPTN
jgi:hypothetical protein